MNKKGEVTSEALVKLIPHALITVVLLAVFVMLIMIFYAKPRTPAEQDFQRILAELDEIVNKDHKQNETIRIPVQEDSALTIITYPGNDAPKKCQKQSCICLYETKSGNIIETCKAYQQIKKICETGNCGPPCFSEVRKLTLVPGATTVTLSRTCHEITLT